MKNKDILRAINDIDWDMVEDARATDGMKSGGVKLTDKRKKIPKGFWTKGALAAACLCLAVITVFTVLPRLNSITPPTPGGDGTPGETESPVESTPGEEPLPENLTIGVCKYLKKRNSQYDYRSLSFYEKLDRVKKGNQMLCVEFSPDSYYFVCAYYRADGENQADKSFNHPENYLWVRFDEETEIPEYYSEARCVAIVQVNKTELCKDIIYPDQPVPSIEYLKYLKPKFENGYNVTPHNAIDDAFVYLNDSGEENIYYYPQLPDHINSTMSCIELDGEIYLSHWIDYRLGTLDTKYLSYEFGLYYDKLMSVMITDKYNVETCPYGLFRFEDIANIFK